MHDRDCRTKPAGARPLMVSFVLHPPRRDWYHRFGSGYTQSCMAGGSVSRGAAPAVPLVGGEMVRWVCIVAAILGCMSLAVARAAEGEASEDGNGRVELTLEKIFPRKSFFGPRATSMSFSRDGRFCAFLYRPLAGRWRSTSDSMFLPAHHRTRLEWPRGRCLMLPAHMRRSRHLRDRGAVLGAHESVLCTRAPLASLRQARSATPALRGFQFPMEPLPIDRLRHSGEPTGPDRLDRGFNQRLAADGFHADSGHLDLRFRGQVIFD